MPFFHYQANGHRNTMTPPPCEPFGATIPIPRRDDDASASNYSPPVASACAMSCRKVNLRWNGHRLLPTHTETAHVLVCAYISGTCVWKWLVF